MIPLLTRLTTHQRRRADRRRQLEHLPGEWGPPVLGHTARILASQVDFTQTMHARHGPVFRASSFFEDYVMLLGPDANQLVLLDKMRSFSSEGGWAHHFGRLFPRNLLLLNFDEHHAHRRAMLPAFRPAALRGYVARMQPPIAAATARWAQSGTVAFFPAVRRLTLQLAADVFLGASLDGEADVIAHELAALVAATAAIVPFDVPGTTFARGIAACAAMQHIMHELVASRRKSPGTDLLSQLTLVTLEDGRPLTDQEIVDHMIFIAMAAHDTTTGALTSLLYSLARDLAIQEELREFALSQQPFPDYEMCEAMSPLQDALREALRLYPPVTALPRLALREFTFGGERVPEGTTVYLSPPFTHRMPELWRDPHRFDPTRFAAPREEHRKHTYGFIPFGGGAHACIGMAFGRVQAVLIVHHLLRQARFTVPAWLPTHFHWLPVPRPMFDLPLRMQPVA